MKNKIKKIKDKCYCFVVEKNPYIRREYENAANHNKKAHKNLRLLFWFWLIFLTVKYRIFRIKPKNNLITSEPEPAELQSAELSQNSDKIRIPPKTEAKAAAPPIPKKVNMSSSKSSPPKAESKAVVPPVPEKLNTSSSKSSPYKIESQTVSPPLPIHYAKSISKSSDYVVFSALDLLFFLPFSEKKAFFELLAKKHGIFTFPETRIRAEEMARLNISETENRKTVTIFDIYELIEKSTGLERDIGVKEEFSLMLSLIKTSQYFKTTYDILCESTVKMIIIEDTVWPAEYIAEMLKKCGYDKFDAIFTSADCQCMKADGSLYEYVKDRIDENASPVVINHDKAANEAVKMIQNWRSNIFTDVNNIGRIFRAPVTDKFVFSAYSGLINQVLYSKLEKYTAPFEFGFIYGGYFASALCYWIHKNAAEQNADKIFFLAPESAFLQKVHNILYENEATESILLPETLIAFALVSYDILGFADYIVERASVKKHTVIEVIRALNSLHIVEQSELYGLTMNTIISSENLIIKENLRIMLLDNIAIIKENLRIEAETAKPYFNLLVLNAKKVIIADTNPSVRGAFILDILFNRIYNFNVEVLGLLSTNYEDIYFTGKSNDLFLRNDIYSAKIFFEFRDDNFYKAYDIFLHGLHKEVLSCMKTDPKNNRQFRFTFNLQESYYLNTISEIHKGIVFWAEKFTEYFCDFNWNLLLKSDAAYQILKHGGAKRSILNIDIGEI